LYAFLCIKAHPPNPLIHTLKPFQIQICIPRDIQFQKLISRCDPAPRRIRSSDVAPRNLILRWGRPGGSNPPMPPPPTPGVSDLLIRPLLEDLILPCAPPPPGSLRRIPYKPWQPGSGSCVLSVLPWLSCCGCPVLAVVVTVLLWLSCGLAVLSWLSSRGCPFLAGCLVVSDLSWRSCPVLAVLFWLSCPCCPVLAVPFWLLPLKQLRKANTLYQRKFCLHF
jgi:hypothetical protein